MHALHARQATRTRLCQELDALLHKKVASRPKVPLPRLRALLPPASGPASLCQSQVNSPRPVCLLVPSTHSLRLSVARLLRGVLLAALSEHADPPPPVLFSVRQLENPWKKHGNIPL